MVFWVIADIYYRCYKAAANITGWLIEMSAKLMKLSKSIDTID